MAFRAAGTCIMVLMATPDHAAKRSLRLRKEEHLKRPAEFKRVFDRRCSVSNATLIVYGVPNELGFCRLGLSVSRKAGPAVHRNRVRRLYREAFRLSRAELPTGLDLVLIPRGQGEPTLADLRHALPTLVQSLARRLGRTEKS
jgi:ribonuclease P protein component